MYRIVFEEVLSVLKRDKPPIILLLGPRQVGKTTLVKQVLTSLNTFLSKTYCFDLVTDRQFFIRPTREDLQLFATQNKDKIIFIDEIQILPEATSVIKYLYDEYGIRFILTGSSELKIRQNFGDTLTGRVREFFLYPLTITEIKRQSIEETKQISYIQSSSTSIQTNYNPYKDATLGDALDDNILLPIYYVYGSLPRLLNVPFYEWQEELRSYVNNLFTKDILGIEGVKGTDQIYNMAKLLAYQIGQLVNIEEIKTSLRLPGRYDVYKYIDILCTLRILVKANPISTNKRKSITKRAKYYFVDNGIRNALIDDFTDWKFRTDKGHLLENAVYVGRKRQLDYARTSSYSMGFFRDVESQKEIDIVVKKDNEEEELIEIKVSDKYRKRGKDIKYITERTALELLL